MMRQEQELFWRQELRYLALRTRDSLKLTQKEMSARLAMSESSYSDIETGRTSCGMLTAILLINLQEAPEDFLRKTEAYFEVWVNEKNEEVLRV